MAYINNFPVQIKLKKWPTKEPKAVGKILNQKHRAEINELE